MLTQAHNGHWFDPAMSGQGFIIDVRNDGGLIVSAYFGSMPGYSFKPMWMSFQGSQDKPITGYVPQRTVFGINGALNLVEAGEATFTVQGDKIIAHVVFDQRGTDQPSPVAPPQVATYHLIRLS